MLTAVHPSPATSLSLGQAFATGHGTVTVGRLEQNVVSAIRLNSMVAPEEQLAEKLINMVSRQHARLEVVAGHLQVVDLGAVNGTYVNDRRMEPRSTQVLQDNDVVSFGGPCTITLRGRDQPNPWVWRVRQLQQFLAAFVPPGIGPPAVAAASPAGSGQAGGAQEPRREVFRFSPGPPTVPVPADAPAEQGQPAAAAGAGAEAEAGPVLLGSDDEAVVSPEPAPPGGSAPPGTMPVQQRSTPATADGSAAAAGGVDSDDSAALDLAGLEAFIATQQGSNPSADGALPGVPSHIAAPQMPPGTIPVHGPTQALGTPAAPLSAPPAAAAGHARAAPPAAVQVPQPGTAVEPDLIDLTGDSPSPSPTARRPTHQQRSGASRHASSGGAEGGDAARRAGAALTAPAPAAAAGSDAEEAHFVDLACSPSKRRHSVREEVEQDAKRVRPSPEGRIKPAVRPDSPASDDAAVGGELAATGQGPSAAPDFASMHQELMCAICQELLVATHSMYPCNHPFCGECLAGWLGANHTECPTCRVKGTAAPVRAHQMDNIVGMVAKTLPAEDQRERQTKLDSWAANRERLEQQLAAPWARGGGGGRSGGGRAGGRAGGGGDNLLGLAAAILGGAGPLAALGGAGPLAAFGGGPLLGMAGLPGDHAFGGGNGGGSSRRRGAAVPHRAPAPAPPRRNEFRVDVAPTLGTIRCAGCRANIPEHTTRIGVRQAGSGRWGGADGGYAWYHLACMPAPLWRETATEGVANLRHVPARDQAYVRERMRPVRS